MWGKRRLFKQTSRTKSEVSSIGSFFPKLTTLSFYHTVMAEAPRLLPFRDSCPKRCMKIEIDFGPHAFVVRLLFGFCTEEQEPISTRTRKPRPRALYI